MGRAGRRLCARRAFRAGCCASGAHRPVLRAWVFADGERLDATAVAAFLAKRLAAIPEQDRWAGIADVRPTLDAAQHALQVGQIRRWIAEGDCYQINLTFPLTFRIYGHPLALYAASRERQPVRYGGYLDTAQATILSFSPELFFARSGERVLDAADERHGSAWTDAPRRRGESCAPLSFGQGARRVHHDCSPVAQ